MTFLEHDLAILEKIDEAVLRRAVIWRSGWDSWVKDEEIIKDAIKSVFSAQLGKKRKELKHKEVIAAVNEYFEMIRSKTLSADNAYWLFLRRIAKLKKSKHIPRKKFVGKEEDEIN